MTQNCDELFKDILDPKYFCRLQCTIVDHSDEVETIKAVLQKSLTCNETICSHVINMNKCNCCFHGVKKNVPCDKLEELKDFWPDMHIPS